MKFIIALLCLVAAINAAPQQPQQQSQAQFNYQNYLNSQTTTPAPPLHPPASIHYVNIGQELNGDYKFGYDTGKGPSGQSFREETRLPDGSVKGQYGYLDAANKMRIVKYTAGLNGFSIDSDTALNEQQIAASKPTAPSPQYNPAPQPQPQQPAYSPRGAFQGLAQAAQSSQPAYLPAPQAQQQQPYSGQYNPQPALPQYNANAYGNPSAQQLTPQQLQAQAQAAARARQAALARQQQQEAIIRQQQQAATEQILAQQRAALEAAQAEQASAKQQQNAYQGLAAQYAAQRQPQYQQQAPQPQYQQPAPQPQYQQPAPQPQYQQPAPQPQQAPTYESGQYQPASQSGSRTTELRPDVLSQFIQLPGTRLIQIDNKRPARPAGSSLLPGAKPEDEEPTGPVVINAALLSYDIGSSKLPNQSEKRA